jgi:hypothetical protein
VLYSLHKYLLHMLFLFEWSKLKLHLSFNWVFTNEDFEKSNPVILKSLYGIGRLFSRAKGYNHDLKKNVGLIYK